MLPRRIVTLLTDFGSRDTFVGQMKGALLAVNPEVVVVDLGHEVPPQDVEAGAFLLETAYDAFPQGTIHLAVVDPGVGTGRRRVAVRTNRYYFVAPDNGILSRVLDEEPVGSAYLLEAAHYMRPRVSATFEGRDVFAPAAAWIARGNDLSNFGPPAGNLVRLQPPPGAPPGAPVTTRVLFVDRFGNAILDLGRHRLESWLGPDAAFRGRVDTPGGVVTESRRTYADGGGAGPFVVVNSAGYLEIALLRGRADEALGLSRGAEVVVHPG